MKYVMVTTTNVQRFFEAADAVQARLEDKEVMGLGLVYGSPGLGKSVALESYHSTQSREGYVRTVPVRALSHWSDSSMMESLLHALGQMPLHYRRNAMFDQIADSMRYEPTMLLIDEINHIAGRRNVMETLKDIHDVTHSPVLMIGEERVDGLMRRFESFYNRFNESAVVHLTYHTSEDVAAVVKQRCEVSVDTLVCNKLYEESGGRSMRTVIDRIRQIEAWCETNDTKEFTLKEWPRLRKRSAAPVTPRIKPSVKGAAND